MFQISVNQNAYTRFGLSEFLYQNCVSQSKIEHILLYIETLKVVQSMYTLNEYKSICIESPQYLYTLNELMCEIS